MEISPQKKLEKIISQRETQMSNSFNCKIWALGFICGVCITYLLLVASSPLRIVSSLNSSFVDSGQFAFTTTEAGDYIACFSMDSANKDESASINIDWKIAIAIASKDWVSVAKKEKFEGVALRLEKVVERVEELREDIIYHMQKDSEMQELSDKTNDRVFWLSITSLSACIVALDCK